MIAVSLEMSDEPNKDHELRRHLAKTGRDNGSGQLSWLFPMGLTLRPFLLRLPHGIERASSRRSAVVLLLTDAFVNRL